jgi:hypothetical protein
MSFLSSEESALSSGTDPIFISFNEANFGALF